MGHSGRARHRDADSGRRQFDESEPVPRNRTFRISDREREQIATALRVIDDARRALQDQQNPANRQIIRDLRGSADQIYEIVNDLEDISEP
jgi:hypothetical protein